MANKTFILCPVCDAPTQDIFIDDYGCHKAKCRNNHVFDVVVESFDLVALDYADEKYQHP